jgi:DNA-directed RNA polymerase subunit RPC12/RpoP
MELIGAGENQPERTWYRCSRCRHALLINLEELKKTQEEARKKPERTDCSDYDPAQTYEVGQAIFHLEWDDVGKIVSKERTSGGARAIVVSFEKLGERRLLENVVHTTDTGE